MQARCSEPERTVGRETGEETGKTGRHLSGIRLSRFRVWCKYVQKKLSLPFNNVICYQYEHMYDFSKFMRYQVWIWVSIKMSWMPDPMSLPLHLEALTMIYEFV